MKINVPKHLIGSKVISIKGKAIIKEDVSPLEFEIIKEAYPEVTEFIEKKLKEKTEDKE